MAKRFANVFFITLGIMLSCVIVFVMVLFLAPGLSIFGIKYIAKGTHIINETAVIAEKMEGETFSGSIRLEVDDVPVNVIFSQNYTYQIEYYDNYNGLTNSKFDDPSISYSKTADGTAVIKVKSFKKFIYENNNSSRYINILIPSTIVGGTRRGETDLTIVSKTSSVSFADQVNDNYDPVFRNINIETSGKITSSTCVTAKTYSLKTINAINIDSDTTASINATNYNLESTGGKIVVAREVLGDISAKTKNARVQVLSCKNLTVDSGFGDVYSSSDEAGVVVSGIANIKTTAGVVKIDSILGVTGTSVVETKTGNVSIKKAMDIQISTTRGFVNVSSARKAEIATSSGSITLEQATASITAKTKRGKVTLGGENSVLYNPTVESTYGSVKVESASGTVNIQTVLANVEFENKDSSNIKINSGKNLTATKLLGAVNIEVAGEAKIDFKSFTQKSTIVGKSNSAMTITMFNNAIGSFSYSLEGNDAMLYEYNSEDIENHHQIERASNITSPIEYVGQPLLTVSNGGTLSIYVKMA